MKSVLFSILLFALSTSTSFGFTEANCPNCSELQARAAARSAAPNTNYQQHRVYVHDLETSTLRSYDVWHETEEGMSLTLITNAATPNDIKNDWDDWVLLADFIMEPFPPVTVPPSEYGSAYDVVDNVLGLEKVFNDHVGALVGFKLLTPLLEGVGTTLATKVAGLANAVTYHFADGSHITMTIVSYNLYTKTIKIEFGSATNAEGLSIFQDPSVLVGSSFDVSVSADRFFNYLDRNNVTVVDVSGQFITSILSIATGGWVCYPSGEGVQCRFSQN